MAELQAINRYGELEGGGGEGPAGVTPKLMLRMAPLSQITSQKKIR